MMMKLEVGKPVYNGYNLSYHSNKTCFVRGAIEGETVLCSVTQEKKTYRFCKTVKVLEASEHRVSPPCKVYGKCGGCQFLHINYSEQLKIKQRIAEEIFSSVPVTTIVSCPEPFRYRNKALIPLKKKEFGFYREKSNKIIEFDDCFLQSKNVNILVEIIRKFFRDDKLVKGIIIRSNRKDEMLLALIVKECKSRHKRKLSRLVSKYPALIIKSWISVSPGESNYLLNGENQFIISSQSEDMYLQESLKNSSFLIGATSFFQINTSVTELLYSSIQNEIESKYSNIIDAYCGTGTIGIFVMNNSDHKITFIEDFPASIDLLQKNLEKNQIRNYQILQNKFENSISELEINEDTIMILDPPRAGIHKSAMEKILESKLQKLIYVSCNPTTLKRDIDLMGNAFNVKEIKVFDMFPQTYHFESMAVLNRKV